MRELGEILWSMPAAELLGIAARVTYVYLGFLAFCGVCLWLYHRRVMKRLDRSRLRL